MRELTVGHRYRLARRLLSQVEPALLGGQVGAFAPGAPICRPGTQLSRGGIAWIIGKYQTKVGNPQLTDADISPHTLRHSKAVHLYEAGVPLPYIRDILGHIDLSTTEIYARASIEAKRRALEAACPNIATDLPEWTHDPCLLDWLTSL